MELNQQETPIRNIQEGGCYFFGNFCDSFKFKFMNTLHADIQEYNQKLSENDQQIVAVLCSEILKQLPEAEYKIWHSHPVWFLDGNPVVGYSALKNCIRLLFWSGQSFDEESLVHEGSFKAAEKRYTDVQQVDCIELSGWLKKAREIQWDYKNLVKRKGKLERLK